MDNITTQRQYSTALTLANAATIVTGIIREIAGNDISNSLNGSKITNDVITNLAIQRIAKTLEV